MAVPTFNIPSESQNSLSKIVEQENSVTQKETTRTKNDFFSDVQKMIDTWNFADQNEAILETAKYANSKGVQYEGINYDELFQSTTKPVEEPTQEPEEEKSTFLWLDGTFDTWVKAWTAISDTAQKFKFQSNVDDWIVKSGLKFLWNLPANTAQIAWDLITVASDPIWTVQDIQTFSDAVVQDWLNKIFLEEWQEVFTDEETKEVSWAIKNEIDKIANEPGRIKEILVENPADVLLTITWWVWVAKNAAKSKGLTNLASKLETVEKYTNPIKIQAEAVKWVGKLAGKWAEIAWNTYTKFTWVNPDSVKAIVKNPELFKQAETWTLTRNSLWESTVKAIDSRIDDLSELWKGYSEIKKWNVVSNSNELNTKLNNITDNIDTKELTNLDRKVLNEAKWYTSRYTWDITDSNLLALRKQVDSILYDPATWVKRKLSPNGERIIGNIRRDIDEIAKTKIPWLRELDAKFAPEVTELRKLKEIIYDSKGNIRDNYIQQISNLTWKGKELKLERIKKIIPDIEDKINALKALEDVDLAKGNKIWTYSAAAVTWVGLTSWVLPAIATFVLTHPSTLVWILKAYNATSKTISSISNKVKKGIKLNTEESKVVWAAIKEQAIEKWGQLTDDIDNALVK